MKSISSLLSLLFICALSPSTFPCFAENGIGFFYIVFQWPGSYCNTKQGCCYPKNGKPAMDFTIGGLWPFYFNGTFPTYCNPHSSFNLSKISDLTKRVQQNWPSLACPSSDGKSLWSHEWQKYGTCSESLLNQRQYFEAALKLKEKIHLLRILNNAGIQPNGAFYEVGSVSNVIQEAFGYIPGLVCNNDKSEKSQLYQIYLCTDNKGTRIVDCPGIPMGMCASKIKFPLF